MVCWRQRPSRLAADINHALNLYYSAWQSFPDLAGTKQSALARLERGEGKPRKATLKKLAHVLDPLQNKK